MIENYSYNFNSIEIENKNHIMVIEIDLQTTYTVSWFMFQLLENEYNFKIEEFVSSYERTLVWTKENYPEMFM